MLATLHTSTKRPMPAGFDRANLAAKGKGVKASYGNPALARQPSPNVIILIDDPNDGAAISGSHITAPKNTLVIVAHGSPSGVQSANGEFIYTAIGLSRFIKSKTKAKMTQYDKVVFVSCRLAMAGIRIDGKTGPANGSYVQLLADLFGKPVYAPTEFGFISDSGRLTIIGQHDAKIWKSYCRLSRYGTFYTV